MKQHANLSIFVPHLGCPQRCSFCDQNTISGEQHAPTPAEVSDICDKFLPQRLEDGTECEIAFFGGSFSAIKYEYMVSLLEAAYPYVVANRASGIRMSTRPDAIDDRILHTLKQYGVTAIELGAQSMQDDVLAKNRRGHTVADVYNASALIKQYGFSLGLQMMPGLYGQTDYVADTIDTAQQFIAIHPDTVRIYPTLTLKNTTLAQLYNSGEYIPPDLETTVDLCATLVKMFEKENIKIIKMGLHADIGLEDSLLAGPYHPAFNELVYSRLYRNALTEAFSHKEHGDYIVRVNEKNLSKAIGQKKANILYMADLGYNIQIQPSKTLQNRELKIQKR